MNRDHDLVEEYLDGLLEQLRGGSGRDRRRTLAEIEDHLREAAAEAVAAGAGEEEAQRDAIARLGSPRDLARRLAGEVNVPLAARPALAAARLLAISGIAVAASAP